MMTSRVAELSLTALDWFGGWPNSRAIDIAETRHTKKRQRAADIRAHDVEHSFNTILPVGREGKEPWTTRESSGCAKCSGLNDVLAAAHTAINEDFSTTVHRVNNCRECARGPRN
jgi:uncharacterized protein with PIN domain